MNGDNGLTGGSLRLRHATLSNAQHVPSSVKLHVPICISEPTFDRMGQAETYALQSAQWHMLGHVT